MKQILLLLFPLLIFSQNQYDNILAVEPQEDLFAVFYNLENLFDTINVTLKVNPLGYPPKINWIQTTNNTVRSNRDWEKMKGRAIV